MRSLVLVLAFAATAAAGANPTPVTFNKEVLPILQNRCQACHRPGEPAPMSLLTYQDARPWARAMREAVLTKKMPPWFADPHYGKFSDDRSLSQAEIDTLVAWVDGGAIEGDLQDAPAPRQFVEGWNIGKPDLIVEMPTAYNVPATGTIEYTYVVIPTGLTEDKWIQSVEVRPSKPAVMHHVIVYTRDPGSKWMADARPGVPFVPVKGQSRGGQPSGSLGNYVPGSVIRPADPHYATLLKAGSDLVFQLHYTPNGTSTTDKTRIGIIFAKEPPTRVLKTVQAGTVRFAIPPGDPNYKIKGSYTLANDAELISMMPHAHVRGKAFEYRVVYPDGRTETLLNVPHFNFNWQLTYFLEKPIPLPKGARIETTAWYDNSANNPYNPDPTKEVRYGDQTFEEMMFGWFTISTDLTKNPSDMRASRGDSPSVE